jgi:uncharacterized membrane protein YciS (DUF1049 family)
MKATLFSQATLFSFGIFIGRTFCGLFYVVVVVVVVVGRGLKGNILYVRRVSPAGEDSD